MMNRSSSSASLKPPLAPSASTSHRSKHPNSNAIETTSFRPQQDIHNQDSPSSGSSTNKTNGPSSNQNDDIHNGRHFLEGVNVASCHDILSIPDPPSLPSSKRRRRSSPLIKPQSSLEDLTNQQPDPSIETKRGDHKNKNLTPSKRMLSVKRARKSLCHVPAPSVDSSSSSGQHTKVRQDAMTPRGDQASAALPTLLVPPATTSTQNEEEPATASTTTSTSTSTSTICLDDDDTEDDQYYGSSNSSKNKRKRQSMALPTDLMAQEGVLLSDNHNDDTTSALSTQVKEHKKPPSSSASTTTSSLSLDQIRDLVRNQCSAESIARNSLSIDTLEQALNYPLENVVCQPKVPSSPTNLQEGTSPTSEGGSTPVLLADRRLLLQQLTPAIQAMDQRKVQDTKFLLESTGCRVEKSKSGKFRYYASDTNDKVPSKEYKRRYLNVVADRRQASRLKNLEWMEEALSSKTTSNQNQEDETSIRPIVSKEEEEEMPSSSSDKTDQETAPQSQETTQSSTTNRPPLVDDSSSLREGISIYRPTTNNEDESERLRQAEQRLWSKIDTALEEYSQEVMDIVGAERAGAYENNIFNN